MMLKFMPGGRAHDTQGRQLTLNREVLSIRKEKVKANFYTNQQDYITSRELNTRDVVFLCSGGHGFEILEDTEMIEVKQGPYSGRDRDKVTFKGIEHDHGK